MPSEQKEYTAGKWQKNAAGRPYRYLEIEGVPYVQWDHTKGGVVRRESPDRLKPRTPDPRNPPDKWTSSTQRPVPQTLPANSEARPLLIRHDSQNTLDRNAPIATQAGITPYGSYPPEGYQPSYSLFPKEGNQLNSTPHSQASILQRHPNTTLQYRQEDLHDEPGRPPPASRNHNPTGERAAVDSLPRNLAGAETYLPVRDTKNDQQNYRPGTKEVRRTADRIYHPDRHDQPILSIPATAPRHEARPNHGSFATEALTDRLESMNVRSNVSGQGGSDRITRHSSALSASTEKAYGDVWVSSRHVNNPREVSPSASNDSASLSIRHEIPRRASLEVGIGRRDERHQYQEGSRVTYSQDDNEDDYGETSFFKSAQDSRSPLPPQQSEYSRSSDQSQHPQKRTAGNDSTAQRRPNNIHTRRPSGNQKPGLQMINEGRELKMTTITESNRGNAEVMDSRYFIRKGKDAKIFFVIGRVFAMLWHENAGNEGTDLSEGQYRVGKFGERIYSTIRRMVVVGKRHGHCTCVPIATYGNQGTLKAGLSLADIEAHAVIYMVGTGSEADPGERIVKNPIAVKPAGPDQKLHPKSRINFDKMYSVEYNVKVMDVGKVADESLHNLSIYFQNTHFPPT